jgi:hypothetical protein
MTGILQNSARVREPPEEIKEIEAEGNVTWRNPLQVTLQQADGLEKTPDFEMDGPSSRCRKKKTNGRTKGRRNTPPVQCH